MKQFIKRNSYPFLIFAILVILLLINFEPGTWLAGWDNYHPYFNFKINLERTFFSVWQGYRGLGLWDGMAHAAYFPLVVLNWLLSIFLPSNLIRYFFHFLMQLIGSLGVYFLTLNLQKIKRKPVSFLVAILYPLNLGAIQMFFMPSEVFSTHFATLPWLSFLLIRFIRSNRKKDLLLFFLVSFLAVPQSFVPTVFVVYLLSVFWILLFNLRKKKLKTKALKILITIFLVNSLWALPYFWGFFQNAKTTTASKVNQMSSENTRLKNLAYGNLNSVAQIKGYRLSTVDTHNNGQPNYAMRAWRDHLGKPLVKSLGWLFFGLALLGLGKIAIQREKRYYPFVAFFLTGFFMLGNDIPLISWPFQVLSHYLPFFSEAFRSPFTKFSTIFFLGYILLLGSGLSFLVKKTKSLHVKKAIFLLTSLAILISAWPAFKKQLYYQNLKVRIPQEYSQLIDYFKKQNHSQRLVILPQPKFWGWTYYDWGFRGAGFIWQGLPQSSMDGAFLPWSKENENFYWQLSRAVQAENHHFLESVLDQYQIDYLIIDDNIAGTHDYKALSSSEIKNMVESSQKFKLVKKMENINIYRFDKSIATEKHLFLLTNPPIIGPRYEWNDHDYAFIENGDYLSLTNDKEENEIYYPFRSLFTGREQEEIGVDINETQDYFIFSKKIPGYLSSKQLLIPDLKQEEDLFYWDKDLEKKPLISPEVILENQKIIVKIPKTEGYYSYELGDKDKIFESKTYSCNPFNNGLKKKEIINVNEKKYLRLTSQASDNCLTINIPHLTHQKAYILRLNNRHQKGKALLLHVLDLTSKIRIMNVKLPKSNNKLASSFLIIPPLSKDGAGYSINFNNMSIGAQKTVNEFGQIALYPIPYNFIEGIKFTNEQKQASVNNLENTLLSANKINPAFYVANLSPANHPKKQILGLSQAYNRAWKAFYFKRVKPIFLKNHVLINNWANGWEIPEGQEETSIYILFWPQLLQFLGFGLLLLTPLIILKRERKKK